jgi:hypothetical protein
MKKTFRKTEKNEDANQPQLNKKRYASRTARPGCEIDFVCFCGKRELLPNRYGIYHLFHGMAVAADTTPLS